MIGREIKAWSINFIYVFFIIIDNNFVFFEGRPGEAKKTGGGKMSGGRVLIKYLWVVFEAGVLEE